MLRLVVGVGDRARAGSASFVDCGLTTTYGFD